jgi:hypothetical protein
MAVSQSAVSGRKVRVDTAEEGLYWGVGNRRRQIAAALRAVRLPLIEKMEGPAQNPALSGRRAPEESFGGAGTDGSRAGVRSVTD